MLEAVALTLGYGSKAIVDTLHFKAPAGQVTALIGPNGCGKSTLLKAFARVLAPTQGEIRLGGRAYASLSAKEIAQQVAFLPQVLPVPEGVTVEQLVGYGRSPHNGLWGRLRQMDKPHVEAALERMGLGELRGRLLADLSGGQRQRAWLAMVLAQDASVVLLDEPTTYLDICHQVELLELMQSLAEEGKTVITVLHDLNQACRYADHLAVMKQGALQALGSPHEVINPALVKEVFGVRVQVMKEPCAGTPMCVIEGVA
ncbi:MULTISPECIES: Fe(3+) dicitrate ABC transporter ATP-binding protein FecE [unclassified Pseudomonas]|uniref:Fe(3+) dicitrate ABC transporter ATP-binding protein FecE n=1 Tax=unclassified Pseudomonas TaxID=196821 RepID=UPI00257A6202|nr:MULTISPECIES: Fe(3+) dicitrate ABC transporter ATP-binding protein FecE [unclassified Pseudomonas]